MTKQITRKYIWLRKAFRQLRLDYSNKCFIPDNITINTIPDCANHEGKLQFAHLHSTELNGQGRGSYERYKDIISNPDYYILLCKKHHTMFDNGELKL